MSACSPHDASMGHVHPWLYRGLYGGRLQDPACCLVLLPSPSTMPVLPSSLSRPTLTEHPTLSEDCGKKAPEAPKRPQPSLSRREVVTREPGRKTFWTPSSRGAAWDLKTTSTPRARAEEDMIVPLWRGQHGGKVRQPTAADALVN